jgi:hypothetical protein
MMSCWSIEFDNTKVSYCILTSVPGIYLLLETIVDSISDITNIKSLPNISLDGSCISLPPPIKFFTPEFQLVHPYRFIVPD